MASGKNTNNDACRDLSGRRIATIKEAQRTAELLESAPAIRAQAAAAERAKLEALEKKLGISPAGSGSGGESSRAAGTAGAGVGTEEGKKRVADVDLEELARKKHKFEDNKFLEQSREINENVRSAVNKGE